MRVPLAPVAAVLTLGLGGCILDTHHDDGSAGEEEPVGPTGPVGPEPPRLLNCSGAGCYGHANVAAGGTTRLSYATDVVTSGPFRWEGDVTVRATAPGDGSIGGSTWRKPIRARPIGAIRLGPLLSRAPRMRYVRASEPLETAQILGFDRSLALHVSDPQAVIQLWSTEHDAAGGAERLVDATLALAGAPPAIALTDWDVLAVPPVAGTHRVVVRADSFGSYALEVPVVDQIDRLAPRVWQSASRVGESAIVCFHAYAGATEVALDVAPTLEGPAEGTGGAGVNCMTAKATGPGVLTVRATADGVTASVAFPIE